MKFLIKPDKTAKLLVLIFFLSLVLRLWHITNPLLDEHSWRQTASAMVARNYVSDLNFFNPKTDFDYAYPMAFGLYEYLVGLFGAIFGFSDILGRIISLLIFYAGFFHLYFLIRKHFKENVALWSMFFYSFLPVSVFYSRSFQTDSSVTAMTVMFLYYFVLWVDERKNTYLLVSIVIANIMLLFKIPSLYMFIPAIGYLYAKDGFKIIKDVRLYIFLVLSLGFPLYFHYRVPIETGGRIFSALLGQDKWGTKEILFSLNFYWKTFYINMSEYQYTHAGYVFLVIGVIKGFRREAYLFYLWLLSIVLFFLVAAKGMHHEYYPIVLMPLGCTFIGIFLNWFYSEPEKRRLSHKILIFVMLLYSFVFSIIRISDRYKINSNYLKISEVVTGNTKGDEKILAVTRSEPEIIYYSNLKGRHTREPENILKYADSYDIIAVADYNINDDYSSILKKVSEKFDVVYNSNNGMVLKRK